MENRYVEGQSYDYVLKDTKEYFSDFIEYITTLEKSQLCISRHLKNFFLKAELKTCYEVSDYYNTIQCKEPTIRSLQCQITKLTTSINLLENSIDDYVEHSVSIPDQYTCENKK